jgi:hypothetical protein
MIDEYPHLFRKIQRTPTKNYFRSGEITGQKKRIKIMKYSIVYIITSGELYRV